MTNSASTRLRIRVWDLPTRALHWALVVLMAWCWWTGTHDELAYHQYGGLAMLWVVFMRLYWGFAGSSPSRFSSFVKGPKTVVRYARTLVHRAASQSAGHNPLGALSVILMLAAVLAVVGLGLFAVDVDGLYSGPLSSYVSFHMGRYLAHLHYKAFLWLLGLIGLHLVAVGFYQFYKRSNLVLPMISGDMEARDAMDAGAVTMVPLWRFAAGAVVAGAAVWAISIGFYF